MSLPNSTFNSMNGIRMHGFAARCVALLSKAAERRMKAKKCILMNLIKM